MPIASMHLVALPFLILALAPPTVSGSLIARPQREHHAYHKELKHQAKPEQSASRVPVDGGLEAAAAESRATLGRPAWSEEVETVFHGEHPNLGHIGAVAIVGLSCVLIFDVVGHLVEHRIEVDPEKQKQVDDLIDGTGAFLGLVLSFLWNGVLTEFVMTQEYSTGPFPSVAFLILSNRLAAVALAAVAMFVLGERLDLPAGRRALVPGLLSFAASWVEESALLYITFPVASIFKSSRVVPTMCVSTAVNGERYSATDYTIAVLISLSVAGFSVASRSTNDAPHAGTAWGTALMTAGLLLDAVVGTTQRKIFVTHSGFGSMQMLLVMSLFSALLGAAVVMSESGFGPLVAFIQANPECIKHLLALGASSALGTYFVFYVISHHGPVVLALMMVVRQVISILLSTVLFGHPITIASQIFAAATFLLVALKPVLKLTGQESESIAGRLENPREGMPQKGTVGSMLKVSSLVNLHLHGTTRTMFKSRSMMNLQAHGVAAETAQESEAALGAADRQETLVSTLGLSRLANLSSASDSPRAGDEVIKGAHPGYGTLKPANL